MVDHIDTYRPIGELVDQADGLDFRKWEMPGPVSLHYMHSTALLRALIGPYGSGKTTTCLVDEVITALQMPRCLDGVRRYRLLVTRDSYRQLYKTCIPSWQQWFPPSFGEWSGGQDRPAEHRLRLLDDFGPVDFEVQFAAIPETSIKDWLDGFEVTAIFMNAANSQPQDVMTYGMGRTIRWPPARMLRMEDRSKVENHIAMDANKTDVDHWFYKLTDRVRLKEKDPTTGRDVINVFDQPGGRHPEAENLQNLNGGRAYYDNLALVNADKAWWVKIFVDNKWGASRAGTPVYEDYNDDLHAANVDFDASPDLELCIGFDAGTLSGGRPSAVFFQVSAGPRIHIIDEVYIGRAGPKRFSEAVLDALDKPHLREAIPRGIRAWCDPSAFQGADKEGGELTWVETMEAAIAMTIREPVSNELHNFRIPTVAALLAQLVGTGPALKLSPRCSILRGGFNSGYRFKRKEIAGQEKEDPDPEKNEYSHPHDALQHGLTGYFGKSLVVNAGRSRRDPDAERAPSRSPFSLDFKL